MKAADVIWRLLSTSNQTPPWQTSELPQALAYASPSVASRGIFSLSKPCKGLPLLLNWEVAPVLLGLFPMGPRRRLELSGQLVASTFSVLFKTECQM
jgi:hypothetical protein